MGIPNFPGVPPLPAGLYSQISGLASILLTADGAGIQNVAQPAQWGIFLNGSPVVVADNVTSFAYKQDWAIADFPLEQGAFQSYDKVIIPFDVRIRFTAGGNAANRQALLDSVANIAPGTTIYSAVMPEMTYPSITVSHVDFTRTSVNGVGLLAIDVWCLNVIVSAGSNDFQSTATPSGADPVPDGTVSAEPLNPINGAPAFTNYTPLETTQAVPTIGGP